MNNKPCRNLDCLLYLAVFVAFVAGVLVGVGVTLEALS